MVTEKAKIVLRVQGQDPLDVSLMVNNWKEWEVAIERELLEVSTKTTTFPFTFTGAAYDSLKDLFLRFCQNAEADVYLYPKTGIGTFSATPIIYQLDFSKADYDDVFFTVPCRNVDLRTLTKQKGNVEFTFDVDEIAGDKPLLYQGMDVTSLLWFRRAELSRYVAESAAVDYWDNGVFIPMPINFSDSEIYVKDILTYSEVTSGTHNNLLDVPNCITALKDVTLNFKYISEALAYSLTRLFVGESERDTLAAQLLTADPIFRLYAVVVSPDGDVFSTDFIELQHSVAIPSVTGAYTRYGVTAVSKKDAYNETLMDVDLFIPKNWSLKLFSKMVTPHYRRSDAAYSSIDMGAVGNVELRYTTQTAAASLKCISMVNLMERIFLEMGASVASGVIPDVLPSTLAVTVQDNSASDEVVDVFVAAETLVNQTSGKLYCSYDKLMKYLRMTGRSIKIDGRTVIIDDVNAEDGLYPDTTSPDISYTEEETADLEVSAEDGLVFASIDVGFTNAKVTGENQSKEYNVKRTFTTFANTTNTLDLTTTVRGDSLGFAILAADKQKDYVENKELFVVRSSTYGDVYKPILATVNGQPSKTFNGALLPEACLLNWFPIIGSFADVFMGADSTPFQGNVNGIPVGGSLFCDPETFSILLKPLALDIATSDNKGVLTSENLPRLVKIEYRGGTYYGYVKELRENPLMRQQVEMKLISSSFGSTPTEFLRKAKASVQKLVIPAFGATVKLYVDYSGFLVDEVINSSIVGWITDNTPEYVEGNRGYFDLTFAPNTTGSTRTHVLQLRAVDSTYTKSTYVFVQVEQQTVNATVGGVTFLPTTLELSGNNEFTQGTVEFKKERAKVLPITYSGQQLMRHDVTYMVAIGTPSDFTSCGLSFFVGIEELKNGQAIMHVFGADSPKGITFTVQVTSSAVYYNLPIQFTAP